MSERQPRSSERTALFLSLALLLAVSLGVCRGAYAVYELGGFRSALGSLSARATEGPSPAPATETPPPTALPTITPRSEGTPAPGVPSGAAATTTPSPTAPVTPGVTPSPSPTTTPTPGGYAVELVGCVTPGGQALKGQVFDERGAVVPGAQVFIALDDWPYDPPGTTNEAGWYEFYLRNDQRARILRLIIGGEEQPLLGAEEVEVVVRPDCFQRIDLRQAP